MFKLTHKKLWLVLLIIALALAVTWQIALAQTPTPNPLAPVEIGGNPIYAPFPGADITQNGDAVNMHGDPGRGRILFAQNCTPCHNDLGTGSIPNSGSDDGTVPPLNPIDPGFIEDSNGDPAVFARAIDLFIQHGSRPAGDKPVVSMIGWGDNHLRTQPEIADLEAYVMQLNGVYWPDRFYPPAEVRMTAVHSGSIITYTINLINHGSSVLGDWTLQDTLPDGLAYIKSGLIGLDQGTAAGVNGSTIQWAGGPNVPQGGRLGPFIIVTGMTGNTVPPNVAELRFTFSTYNGNLLWAGAVSDPILPVEPRLIAKATAAPTVATPLPTISTVTATATPVPETPTPASSTPQATATPVPETPTPVATIPAPANFSVKMVQPQPGALSWIFDPASVTIHVGDTVTWTNDGTVQHSATADGIFDSGMLNPGDSWSYRFTAPGTYTYHCIPHPWMKGTVIVLPAGQ